MSPPYLKGCLDRQDRALLRKRDHSRADPIELQERIPYSVEIDVEDFKETEDIIRMRAVIYVARDSQKGIIIGHRGTMLKRVGIGARKQLEKFFAKKVHLETFVKVKKNWRDSDLHLKRFGYKQ